MTIDVANVAHITARKLTATTHDEIDLCHVIFLSYHPLKTAG